MTAVQIYELFHIYLHRLKICYEIVIFRMKTLIDDHASDAEAMLQDLDSNSFPEVILQLITLKR